MKRHPRAHRTVWLAESSKHGRVEFTVGDWAVNVFPDHKEKLPLHWVYGLLANGTETVVPDHDLES